MSTPPVINFNAFAPGHSRRGGLEAAANRARQRMKRQALKQESNEDDTTSFENQITEYESDETLAPKSTEAREAVTSQTQADLIKSEKPGFWNAVKRRISRSDSKS
jgi:hypothetical protein